MKVLAQNLKRGMTILFAEGRTRTIASTYWMERENSMSIIPYGSMRVIFRKDTEVEIIDK